MKTHRFDFILLLVDRGHRDRTEFAHVLGVLGDHHLFGRLLGHHLSVHIVQLGRRLCIVLRSHHGTAHDECDLAVAAVPIVERQTARFALNTRALKANGI